MADTMPGPGNPSNSQATPNPRDNNEKSSNEFRTMRSDLARLFAKRQIAPKPLQAEPAQKPREILKAPFPWRKISILFFIIFFAGIIIVAAIFIKPLSFFGPSAPKEESTVPPPPPQALVLPAPFFAIENSRTGTINAHDRSRFRGLLTDTARESQRNGTVTRLAIKIQETGKERFMSTPDFFDYLLITPPSQFLTRIESQPMLFIYYGASGPRTGFTVPVKDPARTFRDMISWEPRLLQEFRILLPSATSTSETGVFEDRTYRNIDWRYLKLNEGSEDRGIGYALFPARNFLIFVTSRESFEAVIDRLLSQ